MIWMLPEEGFFDSHPSNNSAGYEGIWSVYPYFESGNIILSDREGFFVVREPLLSVNEVSQSSFILFIVFKSNCFLCFHYHFLYG